MKIQTAVVHPCGSEGSQGVAHRSCCASVRSHKNNQGGLVYGGPPLDPRYYMCVKNVPDAHAIG